MFKTTTVSNLRKDLAALLESLPDGPLLILSHSQPAGVLVDPEMFEALIEQAETLEDILDGRRALAEVLEDPDRAVDAEEAFTRRGI